MRRRRNEVAKFNQGKATTLCEKELEWQYSTIERLREHPQLRRFIVWVRRKPPEFWVRTRRAR